MGQSTNGEISFGIAFEEESGLPWDSEEYDDIPEDWWLKVNGYTPDFYPYTPEGEFKPDVSDNDPRIGAYYAHKDAWLAEHPIPMVLVNSCSAECPAWILAVPGSVSTCYRGHPIAFDPAMLVVSDEDVAKLKDFCDQYGIEYEDEPSWHLSSYWG